MYVCMYMKNMTNGKEYDHTSQKHKKLKNVKIITIGQGVG